MQIHKLMLVVLLSHLNTSYFAHCYHQPDLASFGDFIEYSLSVPIACANATDGKNTTKLIFKSFTDCTTKITASAREAFENLELICQNQDTYLKCWDQLKDDIIRKCQPNGHLPAIYAVTVKSLCGNDKGNTTIINFKKASKTITEEDQNNCPEETGIHWLDNCKSSLETMISLNLCERQDAIDKCLSKITCVNFEFGRLTKEVYAGGRTYMNCN